MGALVKQVLLVLLVPGALVLSAGPARAQVVDPISRLAGRNVSAIHLDLEGQRSDAPELLALLDVRPGQPLDLSALRASVIQLFAAGRFEDVSVRAVERDISIELIFDLVPRHVIDRVVFRGNTGLSAASLEKELRQRFGGLPGPIEVDAAARAIERALADEGYRSAKAVPSTESTHLPERATLVITVEAGPLATIRSVKVEGQSGMSAAEVISKAGVKVGEAYRPREIDAGLDAIIETLRGRRYYEATVSHVRDVISDDGRSVDVILLVEAGGIVTLRFSGDPVSGKVDDLVPVEREGSADDDLLEDSVRRIEAALRRDGYWKAKATFSRADSPAGRVITINVLRGERYRLDRFEVSGNTAISTEVIEAMMNAQPDSVFDGSKIASGIAALRAAYLERGYAAATVTAAASELPPARPGGEPRVVERITVDEGPLTQITDVIVRGATALTAAEVTAAMKLQRGGAFVAGRVLADRDAVKDQYDRRGYSSAAVEVRPQLTEDRRFATIHVDVIAEGPRTVLDRVIIVGNKRVSQETILTAVALRQGQALGTTDRIDLQQRLAELGLFRRIAITEAPHSGGETGTDLVITVEESPATTLAFGGGVEAGLRPRTESLNPDGSRNTVDKLEFAPRASVEVGRSNLFGKNRSVSLFSGISLRPKDDAENPEQDGKCCGFSEYRVVGSFREPTPFRWSNADGLISVSAEQANRPSFTFTRRAGNLQILRRLPRRTTVLGSYSLQRIALKNQRVQRTEQLLVDRVFPQIRLSVFSANVSRDTRNDAIAPDAGELLSADAELAARVIGSKQGFAKTLVQAFVYRRLPFAPRVVLAGGARMGLLRGFVRTAVVTDPATGLSVIENGAVKTERVEDVHLSQRFFAGGSNSVRGFGLDRLGAPDVLNEEGVSKGGNGLVVLNAEVRTSLTRDLGIVAFMDGGNVFSRVSAIGLPQLRATLGGGLRYRSPIGPLRVDFGWKLGGLRITDGRRWDFHFSIGEAF
jgi:outer membrane protein insertion porin family